MPAPLRSPLRPARVLALSLAVGAGVASLAGCGSLDRASQKVAAVVRPYEPLVVQGNFVSREQAATLRPGMVRDQVRDILGSPLVTSVFHADRWDYAFTLRRRGAEPQSYRLSVFFKGDALDRVEGDALPTESEFAEAVDDRRSAPKVPPLEATESQLSKFPAAPRAAASAPPPAPTPGRYPPLEPGAR
mgnify:CR=1 FL=1